jgi:hypothetical protein
MEGIEPRIDTAQKKTVDRADAFSLRVLLSRVDPGNPWFNAFGIVSAASGLLAAPRRV